MGVARWGVALAVGALACQFGSAGSGSSDAQLGDEGDDGDGGGSGMADAGDGGPTSAGTGGGGGNETGAGTMDAGADDAPPADTSDSGSGDMPPPAGGPVLVFVDAPQLALGDVAGDGSFTTALTVRNDGEATATNVGGATLVPPLAWAGGAWPGTGATCGTELPAGEQCDVQIAVQAGAVGFAARELGVTYDNAVGHVATVALSWSAIGQTPNLLVNGDAEQGEMNGMQVGWEEISGDWFPSADYQDQVGLSHYGGWIDFQQTAVLRQDVELHDWSEAIEAGTLGLQFSGIARAQSSGNDPLQIALTHYDAQDAEIDGGELEETAPTSWLDVTHDRTLMPAARRFRVELRCRRVEGNSCSAYFDNLVVRLVYPAP